MCKYCCDSRSQENLFNKNSTTMYLDADNKKIIFEHIEVNNNTNNPWDGEEDILYREFNVEFCPKCGMKL